jgi:hypothetical protein
MGAEEAIARTVKVAGLRPARARIWACSLTSAARGADGLAREMYGFLDVLRRETGGWSSDDGH